MPVPEIDYRAKCMKMIADCVGDPINIVDFAGILFGCVCGGADRVHAGMVKRLRMHTLVYPQHYFGQNLMRFFEDIYVPPVKVGPT